MRYLKIFENFGDKLYHRMMDNEVEELRTELSINSEFLQKFTDKEINRLRKIRFFNLSNDKKRLSFPVNYGKHKSIEYISIDSLGDDWFIIEVVDAFYNYDLYYKCDTLEGVIKYLEDEDLIPEKIPGIPTPLLPK